jgi:hypothetical protein
MQIKGEDRQRIYTIVQETFRTFAPPHLTFKWLKGQKKRVFDFFRLLGISLEMDDVLSLQKMFLSYVAFQTVAWLKWDKATVENYVGFLCSEKAMANYVLKVKGASAAKQNEHMTFEPQREVMVNNHDKTWEEDW